MEHIDQEALAELKEVMEDDFPTLINTYMTDSVERIKALKAAFGSEDAEALRRAAHTFKGSCGNMGVLILADYCLQLENMGRDGNVAQAGEWIEKIDAEYAYVTGFMKEQLN